MPCAHGESSGCGGLVPRLGGLERRNIFANDRDRGHLLDLLPELKEPYRSRTHAHARPDNHYRAIVQTPEANPSQGLQ